jgi:hypothetical protein
LKFQNLCNMHLKIKGYILPCAKTPLPSFKSIFQYYTNNFTYVLIIEIWSFNLFSQSSP